jgi:homoserine dehydrogenase
MTRLAPLRLAIAGLGTVGSTVAVSLTRNGNAFTARTGRAVEIVAVSARSKGRDRGFDAGGMTWFDDPVRMAAEAKADVFIELMGGSGDPAKTAVETAGVGRTSLLHPCSSWCVKHLLKRDFSHA